MNSLSTNVLYYGKADPLPEQIALRAGPLTMLYENGDLRYLKLGEHEIVRRLYVAIRDRNWNTAANQLSAVQMAIADDHFQISYTCTNQLADIDFVWQGTLIGAADGTITCTLAGQARSTFQRNRIGFCLLHPPSIAGAKARISHVDGNRQEHHFPVHIAPQLIIDGIIKPVSPFDEMRAVAHEVVPGLWAEVTFGGETFEMEDQRNWTDASYKTYGTPLRLPFPVTVTQGTKIEQTVKIAVSGQLPATAQHPPATNQPALITFTVGTQQIPLPKLGLGVASHGQPLQTGEIEWLRRLQLAHLRVDLHLADPNYHKALSQATAEAKALGLQLEVAVHLSDQAEAELAALVTLLNAIQPPVACWLILRQGEKTTTAPWVELARIHLTSYDPTVPIGAGTNVYFTELNSRRPPIEVLDVVAYAINPQVHAFDNASLVETLAAQAITATSARQFCGKLGLVVSPITLQPRFNPNATGPEAQPAPGELPPQVDPRQMSLFGAGWTLGSIKQLAETGEVASITYYETTGWRGVMESAQGSPLPQQFPSLPGGVFPLYHLLADVGEFAGGEVLQSKSSEPLKVEGLVLQKDERRRVLLANFTGQAQRVTLTGLAGRATLRRLDAENVVQALLEPGTYRAGSEPVTSLANDLTLPPFGLICLDC